MPEPHAATVADEVAQRLATCTAANGYTFEVTTVSRRLLQDPDTYTHGTVVLAWGALRRDDAWQGTAPWTRWTHDLDLAIIVRPAADDAQPLDLAILQAVRDVLHALNLPDCLGGLVDQVNVETVTPFDAAQAVSGASVQLSVVYRTNERDLAEPPE